MAVNAPLVQFFAPSFVPVTGEEDIAAGLTQLTEWDAGIVDAGTQSKKQIIYIFNNKLDPADAGTNAGTDVDHSDMQNVTIGVVSNEAGNQGAETDAVWGNQWCCVVPSKLSDGTPLVAKQEVPTSDEIAEAIPLGKDPSDGHSNTYKATADGFDVSADPNLEYRISGKKNTGTVSDTENYVKLGAYIDLGANAAAGTHKFRIRVTYSYT